MAPIWELPGVMLQAQLQGKMYNMPVIRKMMIQNTSVPQNGNIDVKVEKYKIENELIKKKIES